MHGRKRISHQKNDTASRNGVPDADKGVSLSRPRANRSPSDSDDSDVMRQLLSPENRNRATASSRSVATARNVAPDGPARDLDDHVGIISDDDTPSQRTKKRPRSARGLGPDSPATTPVGSPSQTPGPNTSSSDGVHPSSDRMDVDSDGSDAARWPQDDQTDNQGQRQASDSREAGPNTQERSSPPIGYAPCHTWPPCGVCAGILGLPTSTLTSARRQKPPPFFPPSVSTAPFKYGPDTAPRRPTPPPELDIPDLPDPQSPPPHLLTNPPRPANEVRRGISPPHSPHVPRGILHPARPPNGLPPFMPPNYPMEPLFISAGINVRQTTTFKTITPAHMAAKTMLHPPMVAPSGVLPYSTLASVTAPGPYSRVPQRNAHASSSSVRVEDMEEATEGRIPGLTTKFRGKGKFRAARHTGRKQRAKRYNRKKREEWPPEGWNPIWEEERPRNWGDYHIPDDIATDKVYDHLKKRFDLKSAGVCSWEGCKPANPDDPSYKMLKRHVETVHLGLKLVCKLCGVRKRADNRRKATHKRGCPEREEDVAKKAAGGAKAKPADASETQTAQNGAGDPEEGSAEDDGADEDDGEEEDELEEDELDEEDELEDDVGEGEVGDHLVDHAVVESEFESEDD